MGSIVTFSVDTIFDRYIEFTEYNAVVGGCTDRNGSVGVGVRENSGVLRTMPPSPPASSGFSGVLIAKPASASAYGGFLVC